MGFLAYDNRVTSDGTWTDNGASFAADPPIANLGTIQTPSPHAEFDGDTASFQFAAGSAFTVRLLALIGHTLPDGATVTWKDESDVEIGSQTIARFKNRPQNSYVLLSAEDSISTIKCAIAGILGRRWRGMGWWQALAEFRAIRRRAGKVDDA